MCQPHESWTTSYAIEHDKDPAGLSKRSNIAWEKVRASYIGCGNAGWVITDGLRQRQGCTDCESYYSILTVRMTSSQSLLPPSGRAYSNVLRQIWTSPKYIQSAATTLVRWSRYLAPHQSVSRGRPRLILIDAKPTNVRPRLLSQLQCN